MSRSGISLCEAMVVLSLYKKTQIGIYDQGSASEAFFTLTEDRSVKDPLSKAECEEAFVGLTLLWSYTFIFAFSRPTY